MLSRLGPREFGGTEKSGESGGELVGRLCYGRRCLFLGRRFFLCGSFFFAAFAPEFFDVSCFGMIRIFGGELVELAYDHIAIGEVVTGEESFAEALFALG